MMGEETINFIDLNGSNAYYSLGAAWVSGGDFAVDVDFVTTSSTELTLIGKSGDGRGFIRLLAGVPSINFSSASGANSFGTTDFADGLLHRLRLTLISGVVQISVDGTSQGSATPSDVSNTTFNIFGSKNSGAYFNGVISNVKLKGITAPANSQYYNLDRLVANTEASNGNTLTYQNIAAGAPTREAYSLSSDGTQWVSASQAINIATQS